MHRLRHLRRRLNRSSQAVQRAWARANLAVADRVMRWRGRPPEAAGVREPRRPKAPLPAAAVALAEPRTVRRHRIRLFRLG